MREHILRRIREDKERNQRKFKPRRKFTAPVKKGEEYDVEITRLGKEGDGIALIKRFPIFIPNTKVGDKVKIKIIDVKRTIGMGEIIESESLTMGEVEKIEVLTELEKQAEKEGLKVVGGAG